MQFTAKIVAGALTGFLGFWGIHWFFRHVYQPSGQLIYPAVMLFFICYLVILGRRLPPGGLRANDVRMVLWTFVGGLFGFQALAWFVGHFHQPLFETVMLALVLCLLVFSMILKRRIPARRLN
jgi:uncharacterized membrane protein YfcA